MDSDEPCVPAPQRMALYQEDKLTLLVNQIERSHNLHPDVEDEEEQSSKIIELQNVLKAKENQLE